MVSHYWFSGIEVIDFDSIFFLEKKWEERGERKRETSCWVACLSALAIMGLCLPYILSLFLTWDEARANISFGPCDYVSPYPLYPLQNAPTA